MEKFETERIITPESIHAEIQKQYSSSREFILAVKEAADKHYAYDGKANVNSTIAKLANIRREIYGTDGEKLAESGEDSIDLERAKKIHGDAVNYALLVSAVYHGEASFVGQKGELLNQPQMMQRK